MAEKDKDIERWRALAKAVTDPVLTLPFQVLLGESADIVRQATARWAAKRNPKTKAILLPGLELAVQKKPRSESVNVVVFHKDICEEIESLVRGAQGAQLQYLMQGRANASSEQIETARFLLSDLKAVLEWAFDDGVVDEKDTQLANVDKEHEDDGTSVDDLAGALSDYAGLAEKYKDDVDGVLGFELSQIETAKELARELRARPTQAVHDPDRAENQDAIQLRNGLAWLLQARVQRVRKAARLVFRHHPEIQREFTSTYERMRRAESRRKKKTDKDPK